MGFVHRRGTERGVRHRESSATLFGRTTLGTQVFVSPSPAKSATLLVRHLVGAGTHGGLVVESVCVGGGPKVCFGVGQATTFDNDTLSDCLLQCDSRVPSFSSNSFCSPATDVLIVVAWGLQMLRRNGLSWHRTRPRCVEVHLGRRVSLRFGSQESHREYTQQAQPAVDVQRGGARVGSSVGATMSAPPEVPGKTGRHPAQADRPAGSQAEGHCQAQHTPHLPIYGPRTLTMQARQHPPTTQLQRRSRWLACRLRTRRRAGKIVRATIVLYRTALRT